MKLRWVFWCALVAAAAGRVDRDWRIYPAVAQTDAREDIYVVGDVHSDYRRLVRVLRSAGVMEGERWAAGHSILVFMGDLIDKGPRALDVIGLVQALRKEAEAAGGQVFSLMGNHEAEFLAEPSEKKSRDFQNELKGRGLVPSEIAACGGEVGKFLCSEPFALRVRGWFFSHAGNTHGRSLVQLIADLQAGVDRDGFGSRELLDEDSLLEARLGEKGANGVPWPESDPKRDARTLLQNFVDALGVKHLVQGHQHAEIVFADGVRRKKGQMFQRDGLLFLVDTGMSEGVNDSQGAVLLIKAQPEEAIAICADGTRTSIWDAARSTAVGAAKVCEK